MVAEGVETLREHKILVELSCDELQGYRFAKPMTTHPLLLWAIDGRSTPANSAIRCSARPARPRAKARPDKKVVRRSIRQQVVKRNCSESSTFGGFPYPG